MAGSDYLTARDMAILGAVGRVPFLSGPELERLFFGGSGGGAPRSNRIRRLRQLRERGLLVSPPRLGSRGPARFALTAAGAQVCLAAGHAADELAVFSAKTFPDTFAHFRLLAQTFTLVSAAVNDYPALTLTAFFGEHFFKHPDNFDRLKTADGRRLPVIPDGLFILRRADGKRKFIFLEADTGSENLGRIARKIHGYEAYRSPTGSRAFDARFHAPPVFDVLFVAPGKQRAENLRRTTAAVAAPERRAAYRFATPDSLHQPVDAANNRRDLFD